MARVIQGTNYYETLEVKHITTLGLGKDNNILPMNGFLFSGDQNPETIKIKLIAIAPVSRTYQPALSRLPMYLDIVLFMRLQIEYST